MKAEIDIEESAKEYEKNINLKTKNGRFDLVMLGMGEDGHTASLFPKTHGLHTNDRLVIANFVPKFDCWRMTLTYNCINLANNIVIYVLGKSKKSILETVLSGAYDPDNYPIQKIGTPTSKSLYIVDNEAIKA